MRGVVLAADVHLREAGPWLRHPKIKNDQFIALDALTDLAVEMGHDLFVAGDLFDAAVPEPVCLRAVHEASERLNDAGSCFVYIQGDHDKRSPPYLNVSKTSKVRWLNDKTMTAGGLSIYGHDFCRDEELDETINKLHELKPDVFFCHLKWPEFVPSYGQTVTLDSIPVRQIWTGDFHMHLSEMYGSVRVLSPGSASPTSIDESLPRRCWLIDDGKPTSRVLPCRRIVRRTVLSEDDLVALLAPDSFDTLVYQPLTLPEDIRKPVVQIKFTSDISDAHIRITSALGDYVHLMLEPCKRTEGRSHMDSIDRRISTVELKDVIEEVAVDPWERRALLRLCSENDPKLALQELEEEFFSLGGKNVAECGTE